MKQLKELLSIAISLAADRHKNQFDKQGMPYILHPLKVMHYLNTKDIERMIIAVLHDIVEDTDTTFEELRALGFTERIITALRLLTKQRGQTQEEYLAGILTNVDAMLVKLADLRHNSDIRRLKNKVMTEKDSARVAKYHFMQVVITDKLIELGVIVES